MFRVVTERIKEMAYPAVIQHCSHLMQC